ncbi:MAG: phosphoglycerate kinase [Candidatus Rhabdochlamydia sp.]
MTVPIQDYPHMRDLPLHLKKVLLRVDYNVPLGEQGEIVDDWRIQKSLPSLMYALEQGSAIVLISHLGRPEGKVSPSLSLKVCAKRLSSLIPYPVFFCNSCTGEEVKERIQKLLPGEVLVLENLRFHPEEENPHLNVKFAKELSEGCDYFVNDAFGALHRYHSSITELPKYFPQKAAMGFLVEEEVRVFQTLLRAPKKPFHVIIGGNKVSSKMGILHALLNHVSDLFIGGGMALTFLKAQQLETSSSSVDPKQLQQALDLMHLCQETKTVIHLPCDLVIANQKEKGALFKTITLPTSIPEGWMGLDIGPLTLEAWKEPLKNASTIFWNGPLGVFEIPPFDQGTNKLAQILSSQDCLKIIGGGDSVAAIQKASLSSSFNHLSTGGGASLAYLEQQSLPGLDALLASCAP